MTEPQPRRRRVRRPSGPPDGVSVSPPSVDSVSVSPPSVDSGTENDSETANEADVSLAVPAAATDRRLFRARWPVIGAAVALLVFIGLVTAGVLFSVATSRIDDENARRAQYAAFASEMVVKLTSLSPGTIDSALATFENQTSGKAAQQLKQSMEQTTDLIRTQGVSTTATVLSSAVTAADEDSGTVIVVSGWTMTDKDNSHTQTQTFRWRVQITKLNGALKMTDIEWVT